MKQKVRNDGFMSVNLSLDGIRTTHMVHRLVAATYIPNPDNLPVVVHIDGNKQNNNVSNLKWSTLSKIRNETETGKQTSNKLQQKLGKPVYCLETGKVYPSQKAAAKELGIIQSNISNSIKNRKCYKGLTFVEFIPE